METPKFIICSLQVGDLVKFVMPELSEPSVLFYKYFLEYIEPYNLLNYDIFIEKLNTYNIIIIKPDEHAWEEYCVPLDNKTVTFEELVTLNPDKIISNVETKDNNQVTIYDIKNNIFNKMSSIKNNKNNKKNKKNKLLKSGFHGRLW